MPYHISLRRARAVIPVEAGQLWVKCFVDVPVERKTGVSPSLSTTISGV